MLYYIRVNFSTPCNQPSQHPEISVLSNPLIRSTLLWEAHELNFRADIMALDHVLVDTWDWLERSKWEREMMVSGVWGEPSSGVTVLPSLEPDLRRYCWHAPLCFPKTHLTHFIHQPPVLFLCATLLCRALTRGNIRDDLISWLILFVHFLLIFRCARFMRLCRYVHIQKRDHRSVVLGIANRCPT